jgi:putative membrane protein
MPYFSLPRWSIVNFESMSTLKTNDRLFVPLIAILSVVVPSLVAYLLFGNFGGVTLVGDVSWLPLMNACINSTVSVLLILAMVFIRRGNVAAHKTTMVTALVLSIFFLVSYILYHAAHGDVKYGGTGFLKFSYLFILGTHIVLSVAVVPLALFAVYRGLSNAIDKHKRIVRWAWPIWLYVSVTGVIVYLFAHVFNPALI